jgi:hypothetical protein
VIRQLVREYAILTGVFAYAFVLAVGGVVSEIVGLGP